MKINGERIKALCWERGTTVDEMLRGAGVSKNAYYTLVRKASILPRSITAVAHELGVDPSELLADNATMRRDAEELIDKIGAIAARYPKIDRDNVRHTLLLLKEAPIERLRRALTRARRFDFRKD